MSGKRVLVTLLLIALATAVVPPLAAYAVNRSRVRIASAETTAVAERLRDAEVRMPGLIRGVDVLCGEGRVPVVQSPDAQRWVTAPRADWGSIARLSSSPPPDPWGNCYFVNLAAIDATGAVFRVLSAGPNGIIETPFFGASELPLGDDVAARIR